MDNTFMEQMPDTLKGHSLGFDEIHNILDSRSGSKGKNKKRTHFILQSRHAGQGDMDLYYTTQFIGQVDKRLRMNTDVQVYPTILRRDKNGKPEFMALEFHFINGQKKEVTVEYAVVNNVCDMYDTHEIVELDT